MSKIEQNKEKKRREILHSARVIFLSEGYIQASMDRISAHAEMTKQTVYRYFPSKIELFQATLRQMGEEFDGSFLIHLSEQDPHSALMEFAREFIQFHLSDEHIACYRLLVSESAKAPEIVEIFHSVGPDETESRLCEYFSQQFNMKDPLPIVKIWTGVLLSLRSGVLIGMAKPTEEQVEQHAANACQFLFAALGKSQPLV